MKKLRFRIIYLLSRLIIKKNWRNIQSVTVTELKDVKYLSFLQKPIKESDQNDPFLKEGYYTFSDVLCPEETAVKNCDGFYFHANYLDMIRPNGGSTRVIVSQQPHPAAIDNFFSLIYGNCEVIIDLRNHQDVESMWGVDYIGKVDSSTIHGKVTISVISKSLINKNISKITISLSYLGKQEKLIQVYQYSLWRDSSVIPKRHLRQLRNIINTRIEQTPILIHCRAGVGRSGVLVAYTTLYNTFKRDNRAIDLNQFLKIITQTILKLRYQRGKHFIQTEEQYNLVVTTLMEDLCRNNLLTSSTRGLISLFIN